MRPEKQLLLDDIQGKIQGAKALVLARYKRLEPNMAADFRMNLAKTGGSLGVVRKRILIKAAQVAGVELDQKALSGHIAIILANKDPVETTKVIYQFCESNEEVMEVIGGRFEGSACSAADFAQIAKLPSQEVMRSQFLGTLEAPMAQTLAVIEALLTSVIYCVDNKANEGNS